MLNMLEISNYLDGVIENIVIVDDDIIVRNIIA
jgi:hypothetical protein